MDTRVQIRLYPFARNSPAGLIDPVGLLEYDGPNTVFRDSIMGKEYIAKNRTGRTETALVQMQVTGNIPCRKGEFGQNVKIPDYSAVVYILEGYEKTDTLAHEEHHVQNYKDLFDAATRLIKHYSGRCLCMGCSTATYLWVDAMIKAHSVRRDIKDAEMDCAPHRPDECAKLEKAKADEPLVTKDADDAFREMQRECY
jgi:hypothetical protein